MGLIEDRLEEAAGWQGDARLPHPHGRLAGEIGHFTVEGDAGEVRLAGDLGQAHAGVGRQAAAALALDPGDIDVDPGVGERHVQGRGRFRMLEQRRGQTA